MTGIMRAVSMLALLVLAPSALARELDGLAPAPELRFSSGAAEAVPDRPWWHLLGDDRLGSTVDAALQGNLDLERTRALVRQANAGRLSAMSTLSPTVNATGSAQVAPIKALGFGFGLPQDPNAPTTYVQGSAALQAAWNLDVFGRNTATWQASNHDALATASDLDDLSESVASLVAGAYLDVVTASERVELVQAQIASNQDLLEVLELRYERGDASSLDVLQQRQQLSSTRAQLPSAQVLHDTTAQRLAVLLGRMPMERIETADGLPVAPDQPAVGTPADLIDNRPDLRAAANRLQSSRDRRWAAYTGALPTVGVSATTGWQFIDRGEFIDQTYWNAGAQVSVPIFNGGRTLAGVQQARAVHDAQEATFRSGVLTAVQQVEAALARERRQHETVEALNNQLEAAQAAFDAARDQYLSGLTPFLNVQSALSRQQAAELALLQGRRDLLGARIAVHEAVGGPWTLDLGQNTEMTR